MNPTRPRAATNLNFGFLLTIIVLANIPGASAADLVWVGGTGLWNAAANWSPAQLPTAADHVFITNNGTYTVSMPNGFDATVGDFTLGGASGKQTLSLGRSTLTLNGASEVRPNGVLVLTVGNSTVTGPGSLTVNGGLNWASGTLSGSGTATIGSSGVVTINGGVTLEQRAFDNAGHVSWNSGNFTAGRGAIINNLAGGTFDLTFDGRLSEGAAPATFNNAGLFRKTGGTLSANFDLPFNNSGTLQTLAGTLSLEAGGTHSGTISNALGAVLEFGGGNHVLTSGSLVTGSGAVAVSANAATLTASGTFDPSGSRLNVTAGQATLTAGCNVSGTTLGINGGTLNFNTASTVAAMNLTAGALGGSSPVTVTGPLTLGGGTINNPLVTAGGGLTITGNTTFNGGKLINRADALWTAGNLVGANGAVVSNLAGATFVTTFDGNLAAGAGVTPTFVNQGLFQKVGGTLPLGMTAIDFQFLNTGTVEVLTNTLRYGFNQQTDGRTLLNGGNLDAQAQPIQLLGGSLAGTGFVSVDNTMNVANSAEISPGLPLGQLNFLGNYQQNASGKLNIEIGGYTPGVDFDRVTVTGGGAGGVATLGGTLEVLLVNGFAPTNGATFTILTALSRAGVFPSFAYPSNDLGMELIYDLTSVTLKVTNLKPVVANPIADPSPGIYGAAFNFQFPANTFSDPDNDPLNYTATGLPPGIAFDDARRTFTGTPSQAGSFLIQVIAHDTGSPGLSATNTFTLTITPAALTVTAAAQTKTYGAPDPALTYAVSGLRLGDTAETVLTGGLSRAAGETVAGGPYAITQGTLAANANYTLAFTGNALTITPAALTVTAEDKFKIHGEADPTFTATYAGFVNNETPAVLIGELTFTRPPGEGVGAYAITPGGLTSQNYALNFQSGTLTITAPAPRLLSVTRSGPGNILLTWSAVSNATYRVQFKPDLTTVNWADLPGDVTASGDTASKTDIGLEQSRFYRLQVLP